MKTGSSVGKTEMVYIVMYSDNKPTGFDESTTLLKGFWKKESAFDFVSKNNGQVIKVTVS